MTRRREIIEHHASLGEIRTILNSMKTLAYIETRKLAKYLDAQFAVRKSIQSAATDFLASYPDSFPLIRSAQRVFLLIGAERGFCGNFNASLLGTLAVQLTTHTDSTPVIIATGHKLHLSLSRDSRVVAQHAGASIAEEIPNVLNQLAQTMAELQRQYGMLQLHVIYHHDTEDDITVRQLLPPFQATATTVPACPVEIQLTPAALLLELTEHYLLAALTEILYSSLMAENHQRIQHLDGAIHHLDDTTAQLIRESNALRQEEITEEIEVILLSAASLEEP